MSLEQQGEIQGEVTVELVSVRGEDGWDEYRGVGSG